MRNNRSEDKEIRVVRAEIIDNINYQEYKKKNRKGLSAVFGNFFDLFTFKKQDKPQLQKKSQENQKHENQKAVDASITSNSQSPNSQSPIDRDKSKEDKQSKKLFNDSSQKYDLEEFVMQAQVQDEVQNQMTRSKTNRKKPKITDPKVVVHKNSQTKKTNEVPKVHPIDPQNARRSNEKQKKQNKKRNKKRDQKEEETKNNKKQKKRDKKESKKCAQKQKEKRDKKGNKKRNKEQIKTLEAKENQNSPKYKDFVLFSIFTNPIFQKIMTIILALVVLIPLIYLLGGFRYLINSHNWRIFYKILSILSFAGGVIIFIILIMVLFTGVKEIFKQYDTWRQKIKNMNWAVFVMFIIGVPIFVSGYIFMLGVPLYQDSQADLKKISGPCVLRRKMMRGPDIYYIVFKHDEISKLELEISSRKYNALKGRSTGIYTSKCHSEVNVYYTPNMMRVIEVAPINKE